VNTINYSTQQNQYRSETGQYSCEDFTSAQCICCRPIN